MENLPTRLCLHNKNLHCFRACLRTPTRTVKYQVVSLRIRSSLEYIMLVIQKKTMLTWLCNGFASMVSVLLGICNVACYTYMNVSNGCHSARTIGQFSIAHGFAMAYHLWFHPDGGWPSDTKHHSWPSHSQKVWYCVSKGIWVQPKGGGRHRQAPSGSCRTEQL